jgi:hypothetical protein
MLFLLALPLRPGEAGLLNKGANEMKILKAALLVSAMIAAPAFGQTAPVGAVQPVAQPAVVQQVQPAVMAPQTVEASLPANTEIVLATTSILSSQTHRAGEKFSLSVAQDVKVDGQVVIPKGTRAVGLVTRREGKGGFGKSGKIELGFRYIDMDGKRIPIEGRHYQAGNGKGAAAVGATVAVGIIGGMMVKGKSARIEEGREFTARTTEAVPVTLVADASAPAVIAATYVPGKVDMTIETEKQRKARLKAEAATKKRKAK